MLFEDCIEAWNGTEARSEHNFGNTRARIAEQSFGFFDSYSCHVLRQRQAGRFFEKLAKIEPAHIDVFDYLTERDGLFDMGLDKFLGAGDRLRVRLSASNRLAAGDVG